LDPDERADLELFDAVRRVVAILDELGAPISSVVRWRGMIFGERV